jgi:hypothetical protein
MLFSNVSPKIPVAIFMVNVFGGGEIASPCIDLAVGYEWEVRDGVGRTEERGAIKCGVTM